MGMLQRTPADVEKLLKLRARDPSKRYILEPYERRELIEIAKKQARLDHDTVKKLATYFGVTMKPVILALQANNMLPNGVEASETAAPPKPERPKLGLKLLSPAPAEPPAPVAETAPPPKVEVIPPAPIKREVVDLRAREAKVEQDLRVVHNMRMEAEDMMRQAEEKMAEAEWLIARAEATGRRVERDPEAKPVRLWTEGMVKQVIHTMMLDRDRKIEHLEQLLETCDCRVYETAAVPVPEGWEVR